jgi:hypothetical protein
MKLDELEAGTQVVPLIIPPTLAGQPIVGCVTDVLVHAHRALHAAADEAFALLVAEQQRQLNLIAAAIEAESAPRH